jgi:hypothetical protein
MIWGLRIRLVGGILGVGNCGNMPELVLVISGFKKHGMADLLLLVPPITLYSFPHDQACMKRALAKTDWSAK